MAGSRARAEAEKVRGFLKPVLWSVLLECIVCGLLLLLFSAVMALRDVPLSFADPMMVVASAAGTFAGGYFCARILREKGMFLGMICGGALFLLLFLCSLPIAGAHFTFLLPVKLLSMLLAGAVGGILGVNHKRKH